jgi:hypothetical protein
MKMYMALLYISLFRSAQNIHSLRGVFVQQENDAVHHPAKVCVKGSTVTMCGWDEGIGDLSS